MSANCTTCQQNKKTVPREHGRLHTYAEYGPFEPWATVHIDHVDSCDSLHTGQDADRLEAAESLIQNVFLVHEFPRKIVANRSTSWRNWLWEALSEAFGFRLAMTVAYRAQANGMAERPHSYLNAFLRTLATDDKPRWDRLLGYLTFAYCQGICVTTQEMPHYLEFGRDLRGPRYYEVATPPCLIPRDQRVYLQALRRRLRAAWRMSEEMAAEAYWGRARLASRDLPQMTLEPGQLMWVMRAASEPVLDKRQSRRLLPRLTGPWRVVDRHEGAPGTYQMKSTLTGKKRRPLISIRWSRCSEEAWRTTPRTTATAATLTRPTTTVSLRALFLAP